MSRAPNEPMLARSLPGRDDFFSLADPIGEAKRQLMKWQPVLLVLANGQKIIVRRKEVRT